MDLGDVMRDIRERRSLTQRGLAHLVGTDASLVSRFELGTRKPTIGFLLKLDSHLTNEERLRLLESVGFNFGIDPVVLEVQQTLERDRWPATRKQALRTSIRTMLRSSWGG